MSELFRCIHCGCRIKMLFVQYSPGNIRLMKCENCKVISDEYIECEIMILLIDLILHKRKAYRHFLYNAPSLHPVAFQDFAFNRRLGSVAELFFFCLDMWKDVDGCPPRKLCFYLCSTSCNKNFADFAVSSHQTLLTIVHKPHRYKDLVLAIVVSSYFKIFLIAMMVWDFPSSVLFIIDILVLSSNAVALKVVTESRMTSRCIWVCLVAHAVKFSSCSTQWWNRGFF
ncbi:Arv1 protein [Macleaya cordata]|uniref:Protein ARV n=1 Tax=Macleaya cordata TaxID=56857 RepID=A0A200QQN1_MACCD|nr:Arv1 protein [Macleaya cordata]